MRPNADGWSIALCDGPVARIFHDPLRCAASEIARFVRDYPIKSCNAGARGSCRGEDAAAATDPGASAVPLVDGLPYRRRMGKSRRCSPSPAHSSEPVSERVAVPSCIAIIVAAVGSLLR